MLAVLAVSVISAMFRSHDRAALDGMANARARVTLAVAASQLTRLAAWDATFLSVEPLPRTQADGAAATQRAGRAVVVAELEEGNFSRVTAVLSRAYQDETSLHWIAVVDLDGVIRAASDRTAAGTALPSDVRRVLRRQWADCVPGRQQGTSTGVACGVDVAASPGNAPTGVLSDPGGRRGIASEWSVVSAGERVIGTAIYDAFGQVVAFAVIGVDARFVPRRHDVGTLPDGQASVDTSHREAAVSARAVSVADTFRVRSQYLVAAGVLAAVLSVFAYRRARRHRVLAQIWRAEWTRAHQRQRVLMKALGTLTEAPVPAPAVDQTVEVGRTSRAAASPPLPGTSATGRPT